MGYPRLKCSPMLNRTETSFKGLMEYSQNKITSLYWEANLILNWTGIIFGLIIFLHNDLFSVNIDNGKTNGLEIKPLPRNRNSQVLSALKSSVGLTFNPSVSQSSFLFLFCSTLFQKLLHLKTHPPVWNFSFYFLITMIISGMIYFSSSSAWINIAVLAKVIV